MQKGTLIVDPLKGRDKAYRIQYRDATGRQVKETVGRKSQGWTKRKAEAELAERIAKVAKGGYAKPRPTLFRDYADRWLAEGELRNRWEPSTITKYRGTVDRLKERFGGMRLSDIRRPHVNDYGARLLKTFAPRSVNLTLTVLHSILELASEEGLIESNPSSGIRRPRNPRYKPRPLTPAETQSVERLLEDEQVRLAFQTFKFLGIRWSELQGLRWRDVDLLGQRLRIEDSKTDEGERWLALPDVLLEALALHKERSHYKHESDFVFCHREKGSRWIPQSYRVPVKEALERAGISDRFRPAHDLRVTSLTAGVLANEHPVKLMARAGHKSYETTQVYIKLAGQVFRDEAEALAAFFNGTSPSPAEEETETV